ncbi:MAG: hypothetical protein IJ448_01475 [Oscillospiraceae bacterium]|nr:hypothetical protein [Oscillospiraceae bacterium]
MVTTGFSRIHVAKYTNNGGTAAYSDVRELSRAKKMETEVNTTDENNFYANNVLAESEPAKFKDGKVKLTVAGLSAEEEAFILGIEVTKTQVNGTEVEEVEYGSNMNPPYLGIGAVKRMQKNGVTSYRAIILPKTRFAIPPEAGETQEENINWQVQELEAVILRDDTAKANWKVIPKTNFATEEEAVAYIVAKLGGKTA